MTEPTYVSDCIYLAFQLGHLSARLGWRHGGAEESEAYAAAESEIEDLGVTMSAVGLCDLRTLVTSFMLQVGDLSANPELLDAVAEHMSEALASVRAQISNGADEMRQDPAYLPNEVSELLTDRLRDALPDGALQAYDQAKVSLIAGALTPAVLGVCSAVEAAWRHLYGHVASKPVDPDTRITWETARRALGDRPMIGGRHPQYIVGPIIDMYINCRNPISHGAASIIDPAEAYSNFYDCVGILRRIAEVMLVETMPRKG